MNRYSQTEILEALNRLTESNKEGLDSDLLKKAEDRVWLSISKSVFNQQLSTPMPNNIQSTPNSQLNSSWQQWWQKKHHLVFAFLGSFTMLVIIAIFSYNIVFRLTKTQTPIDFTEPIPLEELRTKAEAKLIKLSNGISFQEIQQLTNTPSNNLSSIPDQPGRRIINEKLQQEIQNREDPNNLTVFFSELEEKYFLPLNLPFADFDISKSLTTKIWISGSFSKAVDYYDNKIINLSVNTPEYQISYLGGKYAIKGVYTKPYYLSSITITSPKDVEIELLKSLLNPIDSNRIIDYGLQTVNNKKLRVIEVKHDILPPLNNQYDTSPNENTSTTFNQTQATQTVTNYIFTTSTKYYFDQDDLTLHLTEDYTNNQLLKQTKLIKSQILENQQADKIFNYQELGNLPIKEYKIYAYGPDDYLVTNFVEKYDLYFVPELGLENIYYYLSDHINSADSNYYYYDPDFNPNVKQQDLNYIEDLPSLPKNYLGSYYQTPLEVSIYEADKPKYEDMFPYGKQARFKVKKERDVQILLNKDQPINGKYLELALRFEDGSTAQNEDQDVKNLLVIEFKVGKYWYILSLDLENSTISSSAGNFDLKGYLSQSQIQLSKLTLEQAREIDEKNKQRQNQNENSIPPYQSSSLDQKELEQLISKIPEDMLVLPGDLSQKYRLIASDINYNEINDPEYENRLLQGCFMIECFLGYKKTLVIDFNYPENQETLDHALRVLVLDLETSKLSFEELRKIVVVYHQNLEESKIPQFRNADFGIKYISRLGLTYVFIPFKNKTVVMEIWGYRLKEQDYLSIARNMGIKKDLEKIKEQVAQRAQRQKQ